MDGCARGSHLRRDRTEGFPDPWSAFGECLSWESAYAVQLKQAIDQARKGTNAQLGRDISVLFQRKTANLADARKLLDDVLIEYDRNGTWQMLDERVARADGLVRKLKVGTDLIAYRTLFGWPWHTRGPAT